MEGKLEHIELELSEFHGEMKVQTNILMNIEKHLANMNQLLVPAATRQVGGGFFLIVVTALSVIIGVLIVRESNVNLAVGQSGVSIFHKELKKEPAN